jgi:uncharacterized protein YjiK
LQILAETPRLTVHPFSEIDWPVAAGKTAVLSALLLSFMATAALLGARAATPGEAWLPRYDLRADSRRAVPLPAALREVSGLALDGRGRLLAHNDENARVHVVAAENGAILRSIPAGPRELRGDFEGIAVVGDRIFLVTSGGTLLEIVQPRAGRAASSRQVATGLDRVCEVEGLAYDPASAALLLPCKTMFSKQLKDRLVVYAVPLATLVLDPQPRVSVPHSELESAGVRGRFRATAVDVHPRSGSLFVLDGRQSNIVEISADGRVLAARQLARKAHPQPEGIAFGPGLELWIADESRRRGTLTRYRLAPAGSGDNR